MPRNRRVEEASSAAVRVLLLAGLVAYAFALQFAAPQLGSVDGYFHIRYAALLGEAGWREFPPPFTALPLTLLGPDRYYDHHMLFHVGLVPFTRYDLVLGAKTAAAIGAAAAFASPYLFLLWHRVRRAEWWTVFLLALTPGFLDRMEMPRAQSWAVVILVGALALLRARRDAWLLPLAWLFTWTYNAFPAIVALAVCASLAEWLLHREIALRPVAFAAGGVMLGLVVNPYFPSDLTFIAHHYASKLDPAAVPAGIEWKPLPLLDWLGWGGLAALLTGAAALLYRQRERLDAGRLTAALAAGLFLSMAWRWSRFLEYLVPFLAIALALSTHDSVADRVHRLSAPGRRALAAGLALWLVASTAVAAAEMRARPPSDRYRGASRWIASHTPQGSLVFNANWDDFPLLYFHNPRNAYVIGLDPSYLARRDAERYADWERIRDGREPKPARKISERFGAVVAVTDRRRAAFIAALDADPFAERTYQDDETLVYSLAGPPGGTADRPPGS